MPAVPQLIAPSVAGVPEKGIPAPGQIRRHRIVSRSAHLQSGWSARFLTDQAGCREEKRSCEPSV
jgi:hypothetical protein